MSNYFDLAFTPATVEMQELKGSSSMFVDHMGDGGEHPHELDPMEIELLTTRDSFYLATVSESGWPYLQHRGGERGFVKILGPHTIGWFERKGNRQYIGTGNITANGRIAAFFMDYPTRTRLKMFGLAEYHADPSPELLASLDADGRRVDGAITVDVLATAWNCAKHITPRFTRDHIDRELAQLRRRITDLEAELESLRAVSGP